MGFSASSQELNQRWKTCPITTSYYSEALSPQQILNQYSYVGTTTDYQEDVASSLYARATLRSMTIAMIAACWQR